MGTHLKYVGVHQPDTVKKPDPARPNAILVKLPDDSLVSVPFGGTLETTAEHAASLEASGSWQPTTAKKGGDK